MSTHDTNLKSAVNLYKDRVTTISSCAERISSFAPDKMVRNIWQDHHLIWSLAKRDIYSRYGDSLLGYFWLFASPLTTLVVYTVVFGFIMRVPLQEGAGMKGYALSLFCGFLPFWLFSETLSSSTTIILSRANYVKKISFPVENLPISLLLSAIFNSLAALTILLIASFLLTGEIKATIMYLPLGYLALLPLTLGLAWIVSTLGVFFRDSRHIVALGLQLLFFLTPIIYPVTIVPESLRSLFKLNPLTIAVDLFRRSILLGVEPEWGYFLYSLTLGLIVLFVGYYCFMKKKLMFADVL